MLSQCLRYVYQITTVVYFKYLTILFVNYISLKLTVEEIVQLILKK